MDQNERAKWLKEFQKSEEWTHLVVPVLRTRITELEQRTMRATSWEDARTLIGGWRVLVQMLTDPEGFFGESKAEEPR